MPVKRKSIVTDVEQEAKKVLTDAEEFAKKLEGKTTQELIILRRDALVDEAEAKKYLVLLRQRAANMASTVGAEVEHEIIAAKAEWAKAEAWLKAVEKELENEFLDFNRS